MRSKLSLKFLTFIVIILSHTKVRVLQAQNEASALLQWKSSLDKQSQSTLASWDRNNPCQSWIGINCSHSPLSEWVVNNISLPDLSLKGRIDSLNFSLFPNLEFLVLRNNSLFGSLPSNLANLSRLQLLDMGSNDFSGVIPSEIGMLPSLEFLSLYLNMLTGHIPNSICNLTNLTFLTLYHNELTGPIPQEIGMLSANLFWLDFGFNNLTGEIPSSLGNLTHLNVFDISSNHFTGSFPKHNNLSKIEILQVYENKLSGPLPSVGKLVKVFSVSNNLFSGGIPLDIGNLTSLVVLDLSGNQLSGPIPKDINLSEITVLSFDNNKLSGPLPHVGKLVQAFSASNNLFSGGILQEIGSLSRLLALDLSENQLSGPIPDRIFNLTSLQYLNLENNMLNGTLPILPPNIIAYSIKNNKIVGELPIGMFSSRFLEVLHLSNNLIGGVLPDRFMSNSKLTSLSLNGNRLQGLVPRSLMNCRLLQVFDIGNNMINDTFPNWLDDLPQLKVLVLKSNKLHGTIESSRSKLLFSKLRILDLSQNLFTGRLPSKYFENFKAMMDIDEGGRVPTYIGPIYEDSVVLVVKGLELKFERILTVLTTVDLSDNKFEGGIPSNIKMLNSLRYINLSHNNLIGQIPRMLDNLTKLESLDISSNQIQGMIPAELTRLSFLEFFNVSGNQLSGIIPRSPQFNTFGNDSYQGNPGLCGFPLSNNCRDRDPTQLQKQEDDDTSGFFNGFTWESVVLGYGCGFVLGIGLGCLMFSTRKPIWVMKIVNTQKRRKRYEIFQFATRRNEIYIAKA